MSQPWLRLSGQGASRCTSHSYRQRVLGEWAGCLGSHAGVLKYSQLRLISQYSTAMYVTSTLNAAANSLPVQASIFRAAFLDPRSSAVYGVFLFFGAYGLGFLRATNPKL